MKVNVKRIEKKVFNAANERKKFESTKEELIEHIVTLVSTTDYLADGIGETPLRQIVDACMCKAINTIAAFDDERFSSDEDYAEKWFELNKSFQKTDSEFGALIRNLGDQK